MDCADIQLELAEALSHADGAPCLTPALLGARDRAPACFPDVEAPDLPHAMLPDKTTRDAKMGGFAYEYETENFAIKWGAYRGFDDADIEALGEAFEHAWDVEIDDMGYTQPISTTVYRFNVYIGDTGGGTPDSYGAAGYYYHNDGQGHPYIVVAAATLRDTTWAATTASHEFFHALQNEAGTYTYEGQGAWYWEASAVWAENEVLPEVADYAAFLFGVAFRPELPVNFFLYPDGSIEGYHQYGAFAFVRHLTEVEADRDLVRRSWEEAPEGGDPLAVIDGLLAEDGGDIESAFFDYAARSGTWDYEHEDWYEDAIDTYGGWDSSDSHRPVDRIGAVSEEWLEPEGDLPATYGASYWELKYLPEAVSVDFEGDLGPTWRVFVASQRNDEHTRVEVPIDAGAGTAVVEGLDDADEAWLVVAAVEGYEDMGDAWSYRLRVREADVVDTGGDDTDGEEGPKACGCASPPAGAGAWAALISLLAATGRRRARSR